MQLVRQRGVANVKDGIYPQKVYGPIRDEMTPGKPLDTEPALATFLPQGPGPSRGPRAAWAVGTAHSVLPTWHDFTRTAGWVLITLAAYLPNVLPRFVQCWQEAAVPGALALSDFQWPAPELGVWQLSLTSTWSTQGTGQARHAGECTLHPSQ